MASYRIPLMAANYDLELPDQWTARTFDIDRPGLLWYEKGRPTVLAANAGS